jgi:hypothetical protein
MSADQDFIEMTVSLWPDGKGSIVTGFDQESGERVRRMLLGSHLQPQVYVHHVFRVAHQLAQDLGLLEVDGETYHFPQGAVRIPLTTRCGGGYDALTYARENWRPELEPPPIQARPARRSRRRAR